MKLKDFIRNKLTQKEYELVPSSYDVIGDIAIFVDFPKELKKKEKTIANVLLKLHKNIKVVCKKTRKYSGKYRTPKLKIIAGENRKETLHIENGIKLKLDVEKVYFSPRSGTERARIANLVKPDESVLVMFAGCGPYTYIIAKKAKKVTAIELNPVAHRYALENMKLNKITNAEVIKGDVAKIIPKLRKAGERFDRIVMPLPKSADRYLKEALSVSEKGTIIHFYTFASNEDIEKTGEKIIEKCSKYRRKCKILDVVKAGEYAPRINRLCFDLGIAD